MKFAENPWLSIEKGYKTCHADRGMSNKKKIVLDPSIGCLSTSVVAHEMLHIVGLFHEHQRPDRDQYVTVHFDNIKKKSRHNFVIYNGQKTYDVPYDPKSIMHYGRRDGCIDCTRNVMDSKVSGNNVFVLQLWAFLKDYANAYL